MQAALKEIGNNKDKMKNQFNKLKAIAEKIANDFQSQEGQNLAA